MTLLDKAASFAGTETQGEMTVGQWMPIETAPKNGTRVLGCRQGYADPFVVAFWDDDLDEWRVGGGALTRSITHWMPLPAPPSDAALGNTEGAR